MPYYTGRHGPALFCLALFAGFVVSTVSLRAMASPEHPTPIRFLPVPRKLHWDGHRLPPAKLQIVETTVPKFDLATRAMARQLPAQVDPPAATLPVSFTIGDQNDHSQGYTLTIEPTGVRIAAADSAGAFYAVQTLVQIVLDSPAGLPCVYIEDYPDIAARGVMLDISRDKVPTQATLLALVDRLASWKINQLQLYMEHTFAYTCHEEVWQNASPMTPDEIRELDRYCADRCIELVPNQNSFGHMERWLNHDRYRPLAEAPDGAETTWGFRWQGPFSLCPIYPASIKFLSGLYDQLLPNFSSKLFNVGCDETFDIGQGRSAAECAAKGTTTVYLDFLNQLNDLVQSHGRRMQFWGDIIIKHPEQIPNLPKSAIAMEWGYDFDHPFDANARAFADAGLEFYLCPGTSTWNSFAARTDNAIENLRSAARAAIDHHAAGYLITDWGDNGHLQHLAASMIPLAVGAAFAWCLDSNQDIAESTAIAARVLPDSPAALARAWYDLGNVYRLERNPSSNGTRLFRVLVAPPNDAHPEQKFSVDELDEIDGAIDAAIQPASSATGIEADELRNTADLMHLAAAVARRKLGLVGDSGDAIEQHRQRTVAEHRRLWLKRNRPGGLDDSHRRLTL